MNTSAKGSAYENEARHRLEARGFSTMRSAASLGLFDFVAWNDFKLGFFQAKAGRFSCSSAQKLLNRLPQPFGSSVAVVHECRKGCKTKGHVPERFCMHQRFPELRRE